MDTAKGNIFHRELFPIHFLTILLYLFGALYENVMLLNCMFCVVEVMMDDSNLHIWIQRSLSMESEDFQGHFCMIVLTIYQYDEVHNSSSVYLSIYLSVPACMSVCLTVCLTVCRTVCLSMCTYLTFYHSIFFGFERTNMKWHLRTNIIRPLPLPPLRLWSGLKWPMIISMDIGCM